MSRPLEGWRIRHAAHLSGAEAALRLDLRSIAVARIALSLLTFASLWMHRPLISFERSAAQLIDVAAQLIPFTFSFSMRGALTLALTVALSALLTLGLLGITLGALRARWSALTALALAALSLTHPWLRSEALGLMIFSHALLGCTPLTARGSTLSFRRSLRERPVEGDYSLTRRSSPQSRGVPQIVTVGLFILGLTPLIARDWPLWLLLLPCLPRAVLLARILLLGCFVCGAFLAGLDTLTSWALLALFAPLTLSAPLWELVVRGGAYLAGPQLRIYYDPEAPLSHALARRLARLDLLGRCLWLSRGGASWAPQGLSGDALALAQRETLLIYAPQPRAAWEGPDAVLRLCRAIPILWLPGLVLAPLRPLWAPLYRLYARHRRRLPGELAPEDPFPESSREEGRSGRSRTQLLKILSLTHALRDDERSVSPSRWARLFELPLLALTLLALFGAAGRGERALLSPLARPLAALSLDERARAPLPELPEGSWLVVRRAGRTETLPPGDAPRALAALGEARWRWLLQVALRGAQCTPPAPEGASLLVTWVGLDALSLWSQEILLAPPKRLIEGRSGALPP